VEVDALRVSLGVAEVGGYRSGMSDERRYQDHEVRQILDLAIARDEALPTLAPGADGVTLAELREVAREVGLPPARIDQAVSAYEGRGEAVPRGTSLGLPKSVGRIVSLPRDPSDREWELLIAELRTTFGGKGTVTSQGGLREWSHGTLHAFIEPTESGRRLRLADSSEASIAGVALGGIFLAFALLILVVLLGKDDPGFKFAVPVFFSLIGGGLITATVTSLPRWARDREQGMEHICGYAATLLARPESKED
jgi:hypothetical protein